MDVRAADRRQIAHPVTATTSAERITAGHKANWAIHKLRCRRRNLRSARRTRWDVSIKLIARHIPEARPFKQPPPGRFTPSSVFEAPPTGLVTSMNTESPGPPATGPNSAGVVTAGTARGSSFTRLAAAWWALVVGLLILIVLLVFVAQNTESVAVHFLMFDWNLSVGVGYLLAAVAGATMTVLVGAARMIQLRRAAKRGIRPL